MYLLTEPTKKKTLEKATVKGMDSQSKVKTYTIPAYQVTDTNLIKSSPFNPTLTEYSNGTVTMPLPKLFQTLIQLTTSAQHTGPISVIKAYTIEEFVMCTM